MKTHCMTVTEKQAGEDRSAPMVGRRLRVRRFHSRSWADLELVLVANTGRPGCFRNDGKTGNHWVRLALQGDGQPSNRSAIVARVTRGRPAARLQPANPRTDFGYLSQASCR